MAERQSHRLQNATEKVASEERCIAWGVGRRIRAHGHEYQYRRVLRATKSPEFSNWRGCIMLDYLAVRVPSDDGGA